MDRNIFRLYKASNISGFMPFVYEDSLKLGGKFYEDYRYFETGYFGQNQYSENIANDIGNFIKISTCFYTKNLENG